MARVTAHHSPEFATAYNKYVRGGRLTAQEERLFQEGKFQEEQAAQRGEAYDNPMISGPTVGDLYKAGAATVNPRTLAAVNQAATPTTPGAAPSPLRRAWTPPGHGGIDVNSYSGSRYAGNATPISGYQPAETSEQAAENVMTGRAQIARGGGAAPVNVTPRGNVLGAGESATIGSKSFTGTTAPAAGTPAPVAPVPTSPAATTAAPQIPAPTAHVAPPPPAASAVAAPAITPPAAESSNPLTQKAVTAQGATTDISAAPPTATAPTFTGGFGPHQRSFKTKSIADIYNQHVNSLFGDATAANSPTLTRTPPPAVTAPAPAPVAAKPFFQASTSIEPPRGNIDLTTGLPRRTPVAPAPTENEGESWLNRPAQELGDEAGQSLRSIAGVFKSPGASADAARARNAWSGLKRNVADMFSRPASVGNPRQQQLAAAGSP